jgi:hypothetical protein
LVAFKYLENVYQFDNRIDCYDINGKSVDLEYVYEIKYYVYSFGYFNNKFIIGNDQTKNLKILSTE